MDLALNNLQWLICHKTQHNPTLYGRSNKCYIKVRRHGFWNVVLILSLTMTFQILLGLLRTSSSTTTTTTTTTSTVTTTSRY